MQQKIINILIYILFSQVLLNETNMVFAKDFFIPFREGTYRKAQGFLGTEYNNSLYHLGVDYCVNKAKLNKDKSLSGTVFYPISNGKIISYRYTVPAVRKDGVGNYIIIDHGNNIIGIYMHLAKIYKTEGDVYTDTPIGEVGDVILHPKPNCAHLHLEIRKKGVNTLHVPPNLRYSYLSIDGKTRIEKDQTFKNDTEVIDWIFSNFYPPETILAQRTLLNPSLKYEDFGTCPFEGCVYREWTATNNTDVFCEKNVKSNICFAVEKGEEINAHTGVVITENVGRAIALKDLEFEGLKIPKEAIIYILSYKGEGCYKVLFNGMFINLFIDDMVNHRGGFINKKQYDFKVIKPPENTWWILMQNKEGRLGWANRGDNFINKDLFGR